MRPETGRDSVPWPFARKASLRAELRFRPCNVHGAGARHRVGRAPTTNQGHQSIMKPLPVNDAAKNFLIKAKLRQKPQPVRQGAAVGLLAVRDVNAAGIGDDGRAAEQFTRSVSALKAGHPSAKPSPTG